MRPDSVFLEAQVYTPLTNYKGTPCRPETAVASTAVTVELSVVMPLRNEERSIASMGEEFQQRSGSTRSQQ